MPIWREMQAFSQQRNRDTPDEIWILEHPPVYTLGLNGKTEHLLNPGDIPVIHTDRGGQVTYHGPGQVIIYTLLDIKRLQLGIRPLVSLLEKAMISCLAQFGIHALARPEAPGVYVDGKKIGAIGLRIKNNGSYHGLSLNNDMDLSPFSRINPCGYQGMQVTQVKDLGVNISNVELSDGLVQALIKGLYP